MFNRNVSKLILLRNAALAVVLAEVLINVQPKLSPKGQHILSVAINVCGTLAVLFLAYAVIKRLARKRR